LRDGGTAAERAPGAAGDCVAEWAGKLGNAGAPAAAGDAERVAGAPASDAKGLLSAAGDAGRAAGVSASDAKGDAGDVGAAGALAADGRPGCASPAAGCAKSDASDVAG
jgi:hypothetical protein